MNYECLKFEEVESVAVLTLNRPEVLNSFNRELVENILHAFTKIQSRKSLRSVLLSGEGKAFSAGQDLAEVSRDDSDSVETIVRERCNKMVRAIRSLELPVVCAVNGIAAGAGANIALCSDIVFASEKAVFIQAFCNIGLIPDSGGSFFLPRLAGLARASAMTMLGEKVSAEEAKNWGLIYKVVSEDELMQESLKLAKELAKKPTRALALCKRALNQSLSNSLDEQLELEAVLQTQAAESNDFKEGMAAFLEKRKPKFQGS